MMATMGHHILVQEWRYASFVTSCYEIFMGMIFYAISFT